MEKINILLSKNLNFDQDLTLSPLLNSNLNFFNIKLSSLNSIKIDDIELNITNKYEINKYLTDVEEKLLEILIIQLNKYHNTNHNKIFWKILIGHWLKRTIRVVYNRFHKISRLNDLYNNPNYILNINEDYKLTTLNSYDFIFACNDDDWNQALYFKILKLLNFNLYSTENKCQNTYYNKKNHTFVSKKKLLINYILNFFTRLFRKNNDAFIINPFLSKWQEIKLNLFLLQIPQIHLICSLNKINFNHKPRFNHIKQTFSDFSFEHILSSIIWELVPQCYLESFQLLSFDLKKLNLQSNPKFIYTCNNFDTDEIFKLWVANLTEKGIPYYVGQHGNNYGTLIDSENAIEISTSNKFLTWGWKNNSNNIVPAFNFKTSSLSIKRSYNGGVLLIQQSKPHNISFYDFNYTKYLDEQYSFINYLSESIQNKLTIRMPQNHYILNKHLFNNFKNIIIDNGRQNIFNLFKNNKLIVHSYDSTGILETLNLNIPTICFWQDNFGHLVPEAIPYYEELSKAKIFFNNPIDAANHINKYWNNIEIWWDSPVVQNTRLKFCKNYSNEVKYPIIKLKNLLLN